jgi:lysophospholipid acyltransferase (LPLAT)-like uncharacterized protein
VSVLKKLTAGDGVRRPLCWLAAQYFRFVHLTGRWDSMGAEIPSAYWDSGKPFILAFWHGRIMMMPFGWRRGQPIRMLISSHRDGLLIARTVSHLGIETVAGSSSKGGAAALRGMVRALKDSVCVGITPDGPHGPPMRASAGIVQLARLTGVPVIPCGVSAARSKLLRSWDRFQIASPFSAGIYVWGQPIEVPGDADAEAPGLSR